MMQDYPKLLDKTAKVGFTTVPAWMCYSPCKNNSKDAAASVAKGVPAASPYTAECEQYFVFAEMLRRLQCHVEAAEQLCINGITASPSPRIVVHPSCAIFPHEMALIFPEPGSVRISARSSLVLKGNVSVQQLNLDGALLVDAPNQSKILVRAGRGNNAGVVNDGYTLQLLDSTHSNPAITEKDTMRGYVLKRNEEKLVAAPRRDGGSEDMKIFVFNGTTLIDSAAYDGDNNDGGECCACW